MYAAGTPQSYQRQRPDVLQPGAFSPFAQAGFGSYSTGPGTGGLQWNYGSGWGYGGGQGQQGGIDKMYALTGIPGDELRQRMDQWQQTNQLQQQNRKQEPWQQTPVRPPLRRYF